MDGFQTTILTIAVIVLIIILIVVAIALKKSKKDESWPPLIGDCPDYWVDTSGNGANCINVKHLGDQSNRSCNQNMNFTVLPYTGSNSICAKYTWANTCGVTWDGITGTSTNPCSTTSTTTGST